MLKRFLKNAKLELKREKFTKRTVRIAEEELMERIRIAQKFEREAQDFRKQFMEVDEEIDPIKKLNLFVKFKMQELGYRLFRDPGIENPQAVYNRVWNYSSKLVKEIEGLHERLENTRKALDLVKERLAALGKWSKQDQKEYVLTKDRIKQYEAEIEDLEKTLEMIKKRFEKGLISKEEFDKRAREIRATLETKKDSKFILEGELKKAENRLRKVFDLEKESERLKKKETEILHIIIKMLNELMDVFNNPLKLAK